MYEAVRKVTFSGSLLFVDLKGWGIFFNIFTLRFFLKDLIISFTKQAMEAKTLKRQ